MMVCQVDRQCPLCNDSCQYYVEVEPVIYSDIIKIIVNGKAKRVCKNCKKDITIITTQSTANYCPYCGAKLIYENKI